MSEDITFSDWSERLEAGTSHWLPAYGFQQPSHIQEALLHQQDYMNGADWDLDTGMVIPNGGSQQAFLFLETILEETSDDLRSESDYSGAAGWPDSDADSVIHVPNILGKSCSATAEWSGSERDIAVPKKRRRRQINTDPGVHDEDDEEEEHVQPTVSSRSSSLLQFETLEKHCETVFRTSASSEPFPNSPSITSSFSFDSLETSRWRYCASPDSLNEEEGSSLTSSCSEDTSEVSSSDEENIAMSFSARGPADGFRSSSSLRPHRSFDSLVMSDKPEGSVLSGEFSQSLNNNSISLEEEPEPVAPARGLYRTMECLSAVGGFPCKQGPKSARAEGERTAKPPSRKDSTEGIKGAQRSAENLSEDSGFGEHIPRGSLGTIRRASSSGVFTIEEKEDDYGSSSSYGSDMSGGSAGKGDARREDRVDVKILGAPSGGEKERGWDDVPAKFSHSWQSAPDLLKLGTRGAQSIEDGPSESIGSSQCSRDRAPRKAHLTSANSLVLFTIKDDDEIFVIPENKSFGMDSESDSGNKMATKVPVVSTPNLYSNEFAEKEKEYMLKISDGPVLLSRSLSFKHDYNREKPSNLKKTSSRGSNIQITTSFINLSSTNSGSTKGVSFCPVVAEVSWQESFSDEEKESKEKGEKKKESLEERVAGEAKVVSDSGEKASVPVNATPVSVVRPESMDPKQPKSRIGGFFQRFSLRRFSGREKKRKDKKRELPPPVPRHPATPSSTNHDQDVQIIPLHPPPEEEVKAAKPPLPPQPPRVWRKRGELGAGAETEAGGGSVMTSRGRAVLGLLETDIDSPDQATNKKARSLLDLGETHLTPCVPQEPPSDNRAKSMEFLLDKENQHAAQPPENELQKVGGGDRVMSEHQLKVQRSLQKLNIPEWYKNSQPPVQGFLLKRNSDTTHWPGLSSKTTSLSSLGSAHSATPRSPTSNLLSPSPTPSVHTFSRWSTSRLNSNTTSTSTSPCGSARSSFNYRQPYLGWRSQERISRPRTPAERLAAGLLPQKPQQQNVPNLSEVHTSIKEVTSAIANYVQGAKGGEDRLSPAPRWENASSRSASPRGSTGRLCWLESSFVGSRPIDVPDTPVTLTATPAPDHNRSTELYLDLTPTNRPKPVAVNDS